MSTRNLDIFRDILAISGVDDGQTALHDDTQCLTHAGRFIQLGENAALQTRCALSMDGRLEHLRLAVTGHHQKCFDRWYGNQ